MSINSLTPLAQVHQLAFPATQADKQPSAGMFGKMLQNAMNDVVQQQNHSEQLLEGHLLGKPITDIEALTSMKQADLTLKTMVQVRNKVVEAYKELKQIQV